MSFGADYRLQVLGVSGVGKSSLTNEFIESVYLQDHYTNLVDSSHLFDAVVDDKVCFIDIVDKVGHEEFRNYLSNLQRHRDGFLLVYSIVDKNSFQEIIHLYESVLQSKNSSSSPMLLVGNKSDLEYERLVSYGQGEGLAESLGIKFIETSAKNRVNVDEAFYELVREIRKHRKPAAEPKHRRGKCSLL